MFLLLLFRRLPGYTSYTKAEVQSDLKKCSCVLSLKRRVTHPPNLQEEPSGDAAECPFTSGDRCQCQRWVPVCSLIFLLLIFE